MLKLNHIKKDYLTGDTTVHALKGIDVRFRKNEFVAILGPSGCGKTTLLNIIGGLDRYTSGDLFIAGRSTKEYKDADWDSYRNHSIGFVFQSYNLIPHQTVLANVELALTLSGVKKAERRKRAIAALEQVGLGDQLRKKPGEMSGGQMQRVAIARALVNDPEILLADEPTGALDSVTSVQIMEILKEISKDRLIIMVTHNPDLANDYATRIVRLQDGLIIDDSNPYEAEQAAPAPEKPKKSTKDPKEKKVSMSFFTALGLSLNNLLTKKARTFLTAFAGSIGIIGIALILALSNGIELYIEGIQKDTLSSYPISILDEEADMGALLASISGVRAESGNKHENDAVYSSSVMYELINSMLSTEKKKNDLKSFKKWMDENEDIKRYVSAVRYTYDLDLNIYSKEAQSGKYVHADLEELMTAVSGASTAFTGMYSQFSGIQVLDELIPGEGDELVSPMVREQYDLVYGNWPTDAFGLVLVLDKRNEITDITQYTLGLVSSDEMKDITLAAMKGTKIDIVDKSWSYEEITKIPLKILPNCSLYKDTDGDGIFSDISDDEALLDMAISASPDLHIVGIVRPNEDAGATSAKGSLCYTTALTKYLMETAGKSEPVIAQKKSENKNFDIFTGLPFIVEEKDMPKEEQKAALFTEYVQSLKAEEKAELYRKILSTPSKKLLDDTVNEYMKQYPDRASQESFVLEQYGTNAGYSEEVIRGYLDAFSDDELEKTIRDALRQAVITSYETTAEETINKIKLTPSESELAALSARIYAELTDRNTKQGYILANWSSSTAMEPSAILAYLMTKSDDEIETLVADMVKTQATEQYAQFSSLLTAEVLNEKLAAAMDAHLLTMDDAAKIEAYDSFMPSLVSDSTLRENLKKLGQADPETPSAVSIYANSFEDKDAIADLIAEYNESGNKEQKISYTDYVALLMSSVTEIVHFVSYGLIAFVSISLVVSSIMIGIITYISVLERTKEIGILRSIGASKRNISTVFNAETLVIGFISGSIGILATLLLCFPVNMILGHLTDVQNIAKLPWQGAIVLILISIVLTMIAGIIPAYMASKKDPVVALRSE